jgi:Ca2+-binding RTX toxin-like protein
VLDGGLGADRMIGGADDDIYVVDDAGDETIELAGEGIDAVETSLADYTLQANVENLTGNSVAGGFQTLRGNALDNVLTGGLGSDTFHLGSAGHDVVNAGPGDDLLVIDWRDSSSSIVTHPALHFTGAGASGGYRDGSSRSVAFTGLERVNIATGSGDDVVHLTRGGSSARTGAGNDKVYLGSTTDTADGGSGVDGIAAEYPEFAGAVVWDLNAASFNGIEGFEYFLDLRTGNSDDVITTTAFAASDRIDGGRGADEITVFNGHDIVSGGTFLDFSWDTLRVDWRTYNDDVQMSLVGSDYGGFDGQIFGGPERSVILTSFEFFAILTGGGNDSLVGGSRGDILNSGAGNDILDGGAGVDMMSGGTGDDIYLVNTSADIVIELPDEGTDEIRTALSNYSLVGRANVENLTATSNVNHDFRGNSANNVITGGGGNDVLRLHDGGDDTANGGAGNDTIFFIGSLTAADVVNGGEGTDTLVLQGPYGSLTLTANVTQIENISILGGGNTSFGEPGTNRYDYVLTTHDANFAAGVQARINGSALLAGEDFTFDGSAETDAKFVVYGGKGTDTLTGGQGNDIFFFAEERFASGDTVNGGVGYDGMFLRGNYTIDFNAPGYTGLFTNIENLTLTSATDERYARGGGTEFDYNLTISDAIVNAGQTLTVSGSILMASETMVLDASQESDGILRLFGGRASDTLKGGGQNDLLHGNLGADTLVGGGGADSFRYQSIAESNSGSMDHILDFTAGTDKIELDRIDADTLTAGNQAFSWIGSGAFTGSAGQLRAYEQSGIWFVEGDVDGDGVADLVVALTLQGPVPLSSGDFLL